MLVILDTNIWISSLAMASSQGSAIRFFLKQQGARIGLPEVVKLETETYLRKDISRHIDEVRRGHRNLLALFGTLKEVVLPDQEQVDELVQSVWESIGVEFHPIPFSFDAAQAAFMRTIESRVPSIKGQQFKDCVIWEDCLTALRSEDVFLVSRDTGFYQNRQLADGISKELEQELASLPHHLELLPGLEELLPKLDSQFQLDAQLLVDAYNAKTSGSAFAAATENSFAPNGEPEVDFKMYATENPRLVFVEYALKFPFSDLTDTGRTHGKVEVEGAGTYDTDQRIFVEYSIKSERLSFLNPDGSEETRSNTHFIASHLVVGHKDVHHQRRHPIERGG